MIKQGARLTVALVVGGCTCLAISIGFWCLMKDADFGDVPRHTDFNLDLGPHSHGFDGVFEIFLDL